MAYGFFRYLNEPEYTGCLVKEYNPCGKKNCHCATDGKGHKATYLYYKVYTPNSEADTRTGFVSKLKKKYIRKADVKKWQRKIALAKAPFIYANLPLEVFENDPIFKIKQKNKLYRAVYDKYRVKRTKNAKPRFTSEEEAKTREHQQEERNYYLRCKHELNLIKKFIETQNHLTHPYDSKARSMATIKGKIRARQKYHAKKHPVYHWV